MEYLGSLFIAHPGVFFLLVLAGGVYVGMVLMACLVSASQADDVMDAEAQPRRAADMIDPRVAQCERDRASCCAYDPNFDFGVPRPDCPQRAAR